MKTRRITISLTALMTCVLGFALVTGCSSRSGAPTQASITEEIKASVTVLAVDGDSREITLERADGTSVAIVAGPEVRNFNQIKAGDTVNVVYSVTLAVRRLAPDEIAAVVSAGEIAARAPEGAAPAAGVGTAVAVIMMVQSVDIEKYEVSLTDPAGELHIVEAKRDQGKQFVAGLEVGDRVEIAYGEAIALSVD